MLDVPTQSVEEVEGQRRRIKESYPFLDDQMIDACRIRLHEWNMADRKDHFQNPDQITEAFSQVVDEIIGKRYPDLDIGIARDIQEILTNQSAYCDVNYFADSEKIDKVYKQASSLPSSPEGINNILISLQHCTDSEVIKTKLAQIIIYIRSERELRSSETTEGDEVVAKIEPNLITFLNNYRGNFYDIYPWIRELVGIMPKTEIFGIDIADLREDIADFHESRDPDDPFMNVAEEIRAAVHRRLSVKAVEYIDDLIMFLHSDKASDFVAGVPCFANAAQKKVELESDLFHTLLLVKQQLQLIWNNPFSKKDTFSSVNESEAATFLSNTADLIKKLSEPYREVVMPLENGSNFLNHLDRNIKAIEDERFEEMHLGLLRYYLKNVIIDAMGRNEDRDGRMIFNLMTLDSILENLSLIYYANIVNIEFSEINDDNYERAVEVLVDLVLCTRATGQGTKSLGRFGLFINKLVEADKIITKREMIHSSVAEMYNELLRYFLDLRRKFKGLLQTSDGEGDDYHNRYIDNLNTKLLNDIVREKTTHLLGNLLNSIRKYLGRADKETVEQIERGQRRDGNVDVEKQPIAETIFQFGPDIQGAWHSAKSAWFMGGKGASQAEMSNIIRVNSLRDVDVPKGFGLDTSTWPRIKDNPNRKSELNVAVMEQIRDLELRTRKKFGDKNNPLILAARSGAFVSMPGTLATIAHIGLNDEITEEWSKTLEEPCRAYHAYLRFLFNYAENVFGIMPEAILDSFDFSHVADLCTEDIEELKANIRKVKVIIKHLPGGAEVSDDCYKQLFGSIEAVFRSYETKEAQRQVRLKHIPPKYQTACLVQECLPVLGSQDCSGVFFTKDPRNGGAGRIEFIPEFGEDLVGGRAKPKSREDFKQRYPIQHQALKQVGNIAEKRYWHPNDIEFAIRNHILYILQTRRLLLTPMANVITNFNFYSQGVIDAEELVRRTRRIVNQPLLNTYLEEKDKQENPPIANGEPVSGGVVAGRFICDQSKIVDYPDEDVIFFVKSNLPDQIEAQSQITGYVSEEGGATSHAALKSIGEFSCIVGVDWHKEGDQIIIGDTALKEGDFVTIDANEGYVYTGKLPIHEFHEDNPDFINAKQAILDIIEGMDS